MSARHAPFQADYEDVVVRTAADGRREETREVQRLYKDGRGRWRYEVTRRSPSGETERYALLADYTSWRVVLVDLASGQVLDSKAGLSFPPFSVPGQSAAGMRTPPSGPTGPGVPPRIDDLGERSIEGIQAHGSRVTTSSEVVEIWNAAAIDQPPLLIQTHRPGEERTQRLFNVRFGEPDPALFAALDP
jgi:hypothetical protein